MRTVAAKGNEDKQSRVPWLLEQLRCTRFIPAVWVMHILDACVVTLGLTLSSLLTFVPSSCAHA